MVAEATTAKVKTVQKVKGPTKQEIEKQKLIENLAKVAEA